MTDETPTPPAITETGPVDAVLLIDGDNDPHVPPDFRLTTHTAVRVFLRPGVKMPMSLERKLGHLPLCVTVSSPKGGSNAADFVMSLHAGILHATLPMHLPFTLVTADASLAVMAQELQRLGRQALIWTSHETAGRNVRRRAPAAAAPAGTTGAARTSSGRGGRGRGRGRRSSAPAAAPVSAPAPAAGETPAAAPAPSAGGRTLASVAATYASRLAKMKNPPSRLKALLNDITNRAGVGGYAPEAVLEELKNGHGLTVDANGHVQRGKNV